MPQLTPREEQILALLAEGCRNREIARRFGTREQTVKNQLTRMFEKTGTTSRLELVVYALRGRKSPGGGRATPAA